MAFHGANAPGYVLTFFSWRPNPTQARTDWNFRRNEQKAPVVKDIRKVVFRFYIYHVNNWERWTTAAFRICTGTCICPLMNHIIIIPSFFHQQTDVMVPWIAWIREIKIEEFFTYARISLNANTDQRRAYRKKSVLASHMLRAKNNFPIPIQRSQQIRHRDRYFHVNGSIFPLLSGRLMIAPHRSYCIPPPCHCPVLSSLMRVERPRAPRFWLSSTISQWEWHPWRIQSYISYAMYTVHVQVRKFIE